MCPKGRYTIMKSEMKQKIRVGALITAILIPVLIGAFSAFLTSGDMTVYEEYTRPFLAPPGWLFPIVWTILYVMMGWASYLVFVAEADADAKRKALMLYGIQLLMNFFWSTLFFTYNRFLIALIWLLVMWVVIFICGIKFLKIRRAAGLMMGVLFLWTTFAAYLNLSYYLLSIKPMPIG